MQNVGHSGLVGVAAVPLPSENLLFACRNARTALHDVSWHCAKIGLICTDVSLTVTGAMPIWRCILLRASAEFAARMSLTTPRMSLILRSVAGSEGNKTRNSSFRTSHLMQWFFLTLKI